MRIKLIAIFLREDGLTKISGYAPAVIQCRRSLCLFFFFGFCFFEGTNPILDSPGVVTHYALANSFAIRLGKFKLRPSSPCCHACLTGAAIALADWGAIRQTVERELVQVSSCPPDQHADECLI